MGESIATEEIDLATPAAGRALRVVLLTFYNYGSVALRIFHPLLQQRGHEVHSIFFKDSFTYRYPSLREEEMVVEQIERIQPDLVAVCVWSTYYQLAARLTRRIKARTGAVVIWGGIHAQVRPEDSLQHADLVARSEGEYALAELTDRIGLGHSYRDLAGCWVRDGDEIVRNLPRYLIPTLDVLPLPDESPERKYYLGLEEWLDPRDVQAMRLSYDIMTVRGCPFECTFCIHNYTRKAWVGLGTYIRRRSVDHCIRELRAAVEQNPQLMQIALADDIFAPPRPWLEEFCERYKREVNRPFLIWAYPGMVDDQKVRMMRDAGLWAATMGIQSGSERIRRDCYERATPNEEIVRAAETFKRHGVVRNLDFIGDNPYENDEDRYETLELLGRLPKPFYFNYFSLTYFPGVELTDRALRDGHITPADVEDVAEKGYVLWAGTLSRLRSLEAMRWDVAYMMVVYRFPYRLVHWLAGFRPFRRRAGVAAMFMRMLRRLTHKRDRLLSRLTGRLILPSAS
jgi:radical SAM superfamily enzyme YgiQ (UPF0313 family)